MGEFLERFKDRTEKMKIGDPFDEQTTVGAMITRNQAENVLRYIDIAKREVRSALKATRNNLWPVFWNALPVLLRGSSSTASFWKALKTFHHLTYLNCF